MPASVEAALDHLGRRGDVDARAPRARRPSRDCDDSARLPCLATTHAARRDHERRERRDVDRARAVAAGAAGVDARARRGHAQRHARARASPRAAPTISSTVSPFMRSATSSAPICAGVACAVHDLADDRRPSRRATGPAASSARAIAADDRDASRRSRSAIRRGSSRAAPCPPSVRIDSGWNCTPSTRQRLVAHAHDLVLPASSP